jgi:hypothetical protein
MVLGVLFETVSIGAVLPVVLKEPELLSNAGHLGPLVSTLNISEPRKSFFVLGSPLMLFAIKPGYLILLYRWPFPLCVTPVAIVDSIAMLRQRSRRFTGRAAGTA